MASTDSHSGTASRRLDRVEGAIVTVGRVVRPDDLNDLNKERADAATDALALYIEHEGKPRKLASTAFASLMEALEEIDGQMKPLIGKVSATITVLESSGETVAVQVTGARAEKVAEDMHIGDRLVGEGVKSEETFPLQKYDVYSRVGGSEEEAITPEGPIGQDGVDATAEPNAREAEVQEPVDEQEAEETASDSALGEGAKTASDPDQGKEGGQLAGDSDPSGERAA